MSIADLRTLYHLALKPVRGKTHSERLESFYSGQSATYDSFRQRLLKGRRELIASLDFPHGGTWVDLGGGTGENLEFTPQLRGLKSAVVVDLCPSLLAQAQARIERRGWNNVSVVEADAGRFQLEGGADIVTFSYSLTMMPDWFAVLENAYRLLKPGGRVGVVDFHVSRKHEDAGRPAYGWWVRHFWPTWFAFDNVFLNPDHLPYLQSRFDTESLETGSTRLPYLPMGAVPTYRWVGRKAESV